MIYSLYRARSSYVQLNTATGQMSPRCTDRSGPGCERAPV